MKKIFVTGINTGVGKTVVSAILAETFHADYWKPVQTGTLEGTDTATVRNLISNERTVFFPETYLLSQPLSPHAAAIAELVHLDINKIELPQTGNTLIIEGAGGLLVPLNEQNMLIDLITKFEAETVLVIKNYLGCINHTLLSVEALRNRNIEISGLVFNGSFFPHTKEIILSKTGLTSLMVLEDEEEINKKTVLKYAEQCKTF